MVLSTSLCTNDRLIIRILAKIKVYIKHIRSIRIVAETVQLLQQLGLLYTLNPDKGSNSVELLTGTVKRDPKDPSVIQCYLHNCTYKIKTKTKTKL